MTVKSPNEMTFEELCELFSYVPKNRPLSSAEVCELLGVESQFLGDARIKGTGPQYYKVAHKIIRYAEVDILRWLVAKRRQSTSEQQVA